jgi:hypothetical protein
VVDGRELPRADVVMAALATSLSGGAGTVR